MIDKLDGSVIAGMKVSNAPVLTVYEGKGVTVKNGGGIGVTITLNDPGSNEFKNPLFI